MIGQEKDLDQKKSSSMQGIEKNFKRERNEALAKQQHMLTWALGWKVGTEKNNHNNKPADNLSAH